jgi:prevent-host-death family protein
LEVKKLPRKVPIEHLNIAEFNRGQSSKLVRSLVAEDKVAFIQKHGKPMAVVISYERYERLLEEGVDINER